MGANSFGRSFNVTLIGESHGKLIGCVIDGVPAGLEVSIDHINTEMERRRPGQSKITTPRDEKDQVEFLSGLFNGKTTGAPVTMVTWNKDADSSKYEKYKDIPRPSHADYPARIRYGGFHDYRGSGRFSGRLTAGLVMAGSIARQILDAQTDIKIGAHVRQIGNISNDGDVLINNLREHIEANIARCYDPEIAKKMIEEVETAQAEKDSVGGIVECIIDGLPPGIGNPIFENLESQLASMMFAIGAIKGIEFGAGFKSASMRGSDHNDLYAITDDGNIKINSNNAGGILGGLSTGAPVVFRTAIKPTASIGKIQDSIDLSNKTNIKLEYEGRHDPCIVPRIVPVIEAASAIVMVDLLLGAGIIFQVL